MYFALSKVPQQRLSNLYLPLPLFDIDEFVSLLSAKYWWQTLLHEMDMSYCILQRAHCLTWESVVAHWSWQRHVDKKTLSCSSWVWRNHYHSRILLSSPLFVQRRYVDYRQSWTRRWHGGLFDNRAFKSKHISSTAWILPICWTSYLQQEYISYLFLRTDRSEWYSGYRHFAKKTREVERLGSWTNSMYLGCECFEVFNRPAF